jgi:kynurenine formamidase
MEKGGAMKNVRLMSVFLFFLSLFGCAASQSQFLSGKVIDLTHPFEAATVYWPTSKEFQLEKVFQGVTRKGFFYAANNFSAAEHGGTHIDAPIHFYKDRHTVDMVPMDRLMGSGAVIDVTEQCAGNRDYQVQVKDFLAWEDRHGSKIDNVIVLLRTGFGRYWSDRIKYMGTDERGGGAVAKLHFPGLHPKAAEWLVNNRKVKAVGLDTPSIDYGQSTLFKSHVSLFEKNVPVFENLANLEQLPEKGFVIIALPMKIKGGTGGPLRIVAIVD